MIINHKEYLDFSMKKFYDNFQESHFKNLNILKSDVIEIDIDTKDAIFYV